MLKPSNTRIVIFAGYCLRYYILLFLGIALAWVATSVLGMGDFDSMIHFYLAWLVKGWGIVMAICLVAIVYESVMGR
jgi:hypothetical protein